MTTEEIKTLAEDILDQTINDSLFYSLVNIAKDMREGMRPFLFLSKLDSSLSGSGNLPSDFRMERKIMIGSATLTPVQFEEQHLYANSANRYYIDYSARTINLLGGTTGAIQNYYIKTTPVLTSTVNPVWESRFCPLLAYDVVVAIQAGQDADSEFARMAVENQRKADVIWRAMVADDNQKQIMAKGGRVGMESGSTEIDLATM
jgi:hypothetical protein